MLMEKHPVNRATKDILARCMATEDIRVIHDGNAETAYFDTENRVLCLPIWENMTNAMYDMLVGHEVSHALHTPTQGWQDFVGDGKGSRMRHMFINVVEDARIERLIKDKFPGIRRDFADAYKQFSERDLFELEGRTIDTDMPLIDRLNLHFKVGLFGLETIPFTDAEQPYVTRMAETVTFEEVMQLAKELYEMQPEEDVEEDENGDSQCESGEGDGNGDGEQSNQSQSGDGDEDDSESGSQSGDGDEDGENAGSQSGDGDEDGEDSGQSQADDTDDGEGAESGKGEQQQTSDGQNSLGYDDYQEGVGKAGATQNAFEQGVNDLRSGSDKSYEYHTIPTMELENCVIDYKEVASIWETFEIKMEEDRYARRYNEKRIEVQQDCREFLNRTRTTVAQMVQHFQMKQAADADKRTEIAKTGVLDTVNMINYRWSEDIFVKNEVHADGKNHGIVMYIDWSGSMCGIIKDTVEQLLILTEFCQKVNIPFDVYAFSSKMHPAILQSEDSDRNYQVHNHVEWEDKSVLHPHRFCLIQYLSSDMKTNEYKKAVQYLYYLGVEQTNYGGYCPDEFGMGCTPLNEAIMCAIQQVPAFQAKHGVQIVNTVFLTDGDGHSMGASRGWGHDKTIVHDPKTRKDYEVVKDEHNPETNAYLRILQERTGTNLIGIRLYDGKIQRMRYRHFNEEGVAKAVQAWKQHNFIAVDDAGYDKLFIVKGNLNVETDALENISEDASYTKLKNAFMKGANNQKSSRVIATQMIDVIAT